MTPAVADGLFRYQQDGVRFLAARRFALLAYEMGLGKTPVSIRAADAIGAVRIVVVCPAIARRNWVREFERWGVTPRRIHVVTKANVPIPVDADVVVLSFDAAIRPVPHTTLMARRFDLLVVDESHFLKERTAKRTEVVFGVGCTGSGLISRADRCWLLSGTPAPNNLGELWPMLRAGAPDALTLNGTPMSYWTFVKRFTNAFKGRFGWRIAGVRAHRLPEVQALLGKVMLRARASDKLDLPPLLIDDYPIEVDRRLLRELTSLAQDPEYAKLMDTAQALAAETFDLRGYSDKLAEIRRITGRIKAPLVVEQVTAEVTADPTLKVVVFAWHRDVLDALEDGLRPFGCVRVDGRTPDTARQRAVNALQTDPKTRIFLGQIQSCGTAITLTAARMAIFCECSYVPGDNAQAVKRIHRIGQNKACVVRFVSLYGSIDEMVTRIVQQKTRTLSAVFDSPELEMPDTKPDAYELAINAIANVANTATAAIAAIYSATTGGAVPAEPVSTDKSSAEPTKADKSAASKAKADKSAASKAKADKSAASKAKADKPAPDPLDDLGLDLGDDETGDETDDEGAGDDETGDDETGEPITMTDLGNLVNEAVAASGPEKVKAAIKACGLVRARDAEGDQAKIDQLHKALSKLT